MDNDQQVNDLVRKTRDRFLNQPLNPDEREGDHFDLEREFQRAAGNRSFLVPLAAGIFLAVLAAGAVIATMVADQVNKQSTVAIGSFEDLKLKELFDTAKKNQRDIEEINRQVDLLSGQATDRQTALRQDAREKVDLINLANDPPEIRQKKLAQVQSALSAALSRDRTATDAQIAPLKAKAAEIQKKIDGYDTRIGSLNKQNQEVLDSQQRLFQIEKKKLTDFYDGKIRSLSSDNSQAIAKLKSDRDRYVTALNAKHADEVKQLILKFNPVVTDPDISAVLTNYDSVSVEFTPAALPDRLVKEGLIKPEVHQSLLDRAAKARKLIELLQATPYVNSMPSIIHSLDALTAEALNGYDGYLAPIGNRMNTLFISDRVKSGVVEFVASLKDHDGLVLDARDAKDLVLIIKKDKADGLKEDETAVVRDPNNNDEIATIGLTVTDDYVQGKVISQKNVFRPVKAFDRLQIKPKEQIK